MAIKLTCPGCRDAVQADEVDRGKKIKCGTCWSDVDVPPAPVAPAKAAPIPTARAIPAAQVAGVPPVASATPAGPKKATPLPVETPARPVVATALPAAQAKPAEAKRKAREDEPEGKKPRFKERDRDRYDDDDDDRPRAKKGGGGGVLLAFICIGAMLLGTAGAIAVLVMNNQPTAAANTSQTTPTDSGGPAPNFNPNPPRNPGDFNLNPNPNAIPVAPPKALRPAGWAEVRGKDFSCDMPAGVAKEPAAFTFATRNVTGTSYSAGEQNNAIKVTAKELTLPVATSATSSAFVAEAFGVPEGGLKRDAGRLVSGNDGVEFKATTADGYENVFLAVGVGTRNGFMFRFAWKPGTADAADKRDSFFASVDIRAEGDVPVARPDPFGRPDPKVAKPITVPWKKLENKDGFSVEVPPGGKKPERHVLELENRNGLLTGRKWTTDDGDVMYHIYFHDLPPGQEDMDLKKVAKPLVAAVFPYNLQGEGEDTKVDGKAATRWDVREFNGNITHGVSVRVGFRVFTLFVTGMHNNKGATVIDRQDRFLNSVRIMFDPKTHNPYADEPDWVPMTKTTGFTALIPRQATTSAEFKPFFFAEAPAGKEWKADVDGVLYQVYVVDFALKPGVKRNDFSNKTPADLVKHFTQSEQVHEGPDQKAKLGTLPAEGYTLKQGDSYSQMRVAVSGQLVYVAKVNRHGWDKKVGDKELADKTARFFNTFRLGEGVIADNGGMGGGAAESTGDFAKVPDARVLPFSAGVFLTQKKEFLTFGVKDATAKPVRGVVRRYSLPDFKLKATYETPSPINRVAADEMNGKLYAATMRDAADAKVPERENVIATGDVQQYDLKKLTDGTLADAEQLRPVNTLSSAAAAFKVSGLEVSPDGSAVYVSGVTVSGKGAQQTLRGKLMKWETANGKFAADIATDSPLWAMDLSADGKAVVVVERTTDPARPFGNVVVVDGPGWKRTATIPVTGAPNDVAVRNERVATVTSVGPGQGRVLIGMADAGELTETTPGGDVTYVRFTPGGTKLLVSTGGQGSGLALYDVGTVKPPKLTKVASATDLGGLFIISPDGKMAVMNTGTVLDLEKSKAK